MINISALIEELKFKKAIEMLGAYQSEEEYLDAMLAITECDIRKDPRFPQ